MFPDHWGDPDVCVDGHEKTVTDLHVARVAVRNPQIVAAAHYYGVTIATCLPADPESKGGSEATVRIAKADLVPTAANLLPEYESFRAARGGLREAATVRFNTRVHAVTGEKPAVRLVRELEVLHRVPAEPYTAAFGRDPRGDVVIDDLVSGCPLLGAAHLDGETGLGPHLGRRDRHLAEVGDAATEIARHLVVGRGEASIVDAHYPPRRDTAERAPKATNPFEESFLQIGPGAERWLIEAAAQGTRGVTTRMGEAVALAEVWAATSSTKHSGLGATVGRFAQGDLESILAPAAAEPLPPPVGFSLQPGTAAWARYGTSTNDNGNGDGDGDGGGGR